MGPVIIAGYFNAHLGSMWGPRAVVPRVRKPGGHGVRMVGLLMVHSI